MAQGASYLEVLIDRIVESQGEVKYMPATELWLYAISEAKTAKEEEKKRPETK